MSTAMRMLDEGTVYVSGDRFVCGTIACAGSSACFTGRGIDGQKVRAVDAQDVAEWATFPEMGPIKCECGAVTAGGE